MSPSDLRQFICQALKVLSNKQNWSERPYIHEENVQRLGDCKWYKVYDVIERVVEYLGERNYDSDVYQNFTDELNEFFVEHGIGWKLLDGRVEIRSPKSFEVILKSAIETELQAGHLTVGNELNRPGFLT